MCCWHKAHIVPNLIPWHNSASSLQIRSSLWTHSLHIECWCWYPTTRLKELYRGGERAKDWKASGGRKLCGAICVIWTDTYLTLQFNPVTVLNNKSEFKIEPYVHLIVRYNAAFRSSVSRLRTENVKMLVYRTQVWEQFLPPPSPKSPPSTSCWMQSPWFFVFQGLIVIPFWNIFPFIRFIRIS